MIKIFIDTDVILDLLAKREPFYFHAAQLFSLIENKMVPAFVSPLSFSNLYYILRRQSDRKIALKSLQKLRLLVEMTPIDSKAIDLALLSDFKDFEDAIQNFTAFNNKIDFIITRNVKDYKSSALNIATAKEFLEIYKSRIQMDDGETK